MRGGILRGVMIAAALAAGGCAGARYEEPMPVGDPQLAGRLHAAREAMPEKIEATQRAVLVAGGKEYAFTGYVSVKRPAEIRLVATGEMGGTAFDVERRADGTRVVRRSAEGLRERWLIEGALRDAEAMYLWRPSARAWPARIGDSYALVDEGKGRIRREFLFDAENLAPTGVRVVERGRVTYEARFEYEGEGAGPRRAEIADRWLGYRLRVEVVETRL